MPFRSAKQRRYLWANEPEIARDWTDTYGSGIHKALGGRIGFAGTTREEFEKKAQEQKEKFYQRQEDLRTKEGISEEEIKAGTVTGEMLDDQIRKLGKTQEVQDVVEKRQSEYEWDGKGDYQLELDKIKIHTQREVIKEAGGGSFKKGMEMIGGGGGGGAKRIGVLGDEGINLDEFMNDRLQERIREAEERIREQIGSLPEVPKPLTGLDLAQDNPVFDETTGQWYNKPGGYPIPDPNIPKKMDMYNMPYTTEPYGPIAKQASFTDKNIPLPHEQKILDAIKNRVASKKQNVPLRFRDAEYLSDYFNREQNALRRDNRYFNRGDARTGPEKWMGGLGNMGQRWMKGFRNVRRDIGQGIGNFMGDRFQYKPAVASAGGYSAAQLNQLNARGGYYSPPARQQRQDRARVANLLARKAADKPYSQANLNQLTMGSRPGHYDPPGGDRSVRGTSSPSKPGGWHPGVARGGRIGRNEGGLASIWPR